jgi:drug/metabolite transporter (DMT)-like permease
MSLRRDALLPSSALVFNAFIWGVSWWPFRWLHERGMHPLWATMLIYLVATLAITVARPGTWAQLRRAPALWVIALASGTTNAAFNWGVTVGDVVRVVLLFYLMPLWAVLLARWLLGEGLTPRAGLRVLMALVGAAIVLWPGHGDGAQPFGVADVLGVIGGLSFALNNVMLRREARRDGSARALAMFLGGAAVAGLAALGLADAGRAPWPPAPALGWLGGALALAAMFLTSNVALQYGASRLPANTTAVIMLTEVLFASLSALALGGGTLTPRLALGGTLIVGAALMAAWISEPPAARSAASRAG